MSYEYVKYEKLPITSFLDIDMGMYSYPLKDFLDKIKGYYTKSIFDYSDLVENFDFFEKLYARREKNYIKFWTVVSINNYKNREKIFNAELKLQKMYPNTNFSFRIMQNTKNNITKIPKNAYEL